MNFSPSSFVRQSIDSLCQAAHTTVALVLVFWAALIDVVQWPDNTARMREKVRPV